MDIKVIALGVTRIIAQRTLRELAKEKNEKKRRILIELLRQSFRVGKNLHVLLEKIKRKNNPEPSVQNEMAMISESFAKDYESYGRPKTF